MAYLMDRRLYGPMYEDGSSGLLSPDAGMQVPQVQPAPNYQPLSQQLTNFWKQNQIDPNIRGINRADELSQILSHYGINDLSQLSLKSTPYQRVEQTQTGPWSDSADATYADTVVTDPGYQLAYGDKTFGDLGGFDTNGNPVYLNTPPQQYLQQIGENRYRIAGSSAGKGVTDFVASFTPEGKLESIVPQWRSSSDWPAIRQALLTVGGVVAGGMGLESLLGGAGAGAGLSAADAAYALGMGETAAGGTLGTAAAGGSAGLLGPDLGSAIAASASDAVPSTLMGSGGMDAAVAASASGSGGSSLGNMASNAMNWMKANPTAGRLLMSGVSGLLSASGGSSGGSSGGYKDSGYRPTITRGNWQPSVTPRSMAMTPTSINLPTTGNAGSGLWRYGLLGG